MSAGKNGCVPHGGRVERAALSARRDGHRRRCTARRPRGLAGSRQAATRALLKTLRIVADRVRVRERVTYRVQDRSEHRILQFPKTVVNPETGPTRLDQTRAPQVGQVP